MSRIGLVLAALCVVTATAWAGDPNRWQAWVSPTDGESNAVDVSMVSGDRVACGKKPWIQLQPRFRNRYQERITGHLKIEYIDVDGNGQVATPEFDPNAGETKIMALAAFCHDPRQSLKFSIADMKFPAREAEKARLEAQRLAAEKAAAEEAARKKAEKDKAAAEQAAIEAAKREEAKKEAERLAKEGESSRKQTAAEIRAGQLESEESRNAAREAEAYRQKRQLEAETEANRNVRVDELAADTFRNGEIIFGAPIGFQNTKFGAETEGRFTVGGRVQLRLYKWLKRLSARGEPLSGSGLELTLEGGYATTIDIGENSSGAHFRVSGGHAHARYWHGSLGIGAFGEWTHYWYDPPGNPNGTYDLYALGPELAFGIVASRSLALELALRGGAVASGSGLAFDTSTDLFVAASALAELNYLYGGAIATRYATSSTVDSWNALAVLGVRLPF
ncbi:MAG TPA: hypothetical protein VMZ53_30140 [Kofleriaceae bacterium]|nr:hypothetical protein [Kofleriaceae bacterium]